MRGRREGESRRGLPAVDDVCEREDNAVAKVGTQQFLHQFPRSEKTPVPAHRPLLIPSGIYRDHNSLCPMVTVAYEGCPIMLCSIMTSSTGQNSYVSDR